MSYVIFSSYFCGQLKVFMKQLKLTKKYENKKGWPLKRSSLKLAPRKRMAVLFHPRVPESARSAFGFIEGVDLFPFGLFVPGDDHLSDALAGIDDEIFLGQVDQDHADFPAVVGVDGAGGVEDGDAFLGGETAAGTDLGFKSFGQGNEQAGGDDGAFKAAEGDAFADVGFQIHAGGLGRGVFRAGPGAAVDDLDFHTQI